MAKKINYQTQIEKKEQQLMSLKNELEELKKNYNSEMEEFIDYIKSFKNKKSPAELKQILENALV